MNKNLCIIPARGGSKRIPRKNIKHFRGKPIIAYSIEAALNSGLFTSVMVSTDDKEIAEIGKIYGAEVPFLRSVKTSDDFATTVDVLLEVLESYKELGAEFDKMCCIYPTAPFVTEAKLRQAFEKLSSENLDAVFPVVQFSYPITRALKMQGNKLQFFFPEFKNSRSQDLEKAFHDAGQFYFINSRTFVNTHAIITDNTGGITISEMEAQDIDTETDWKLAELKYELLQSFK